MTEMILRFLCEEPRLSDPLCAGQATECSEGAIPLVTGRSTGRGIAMQGLEPQIPTDNRPPH